MVKLSENSDEDWDKKYASAKSTAEEGIDLTEEVDRKVVSKLNKPSKSSQVGGQPKS
jgi:hypothetical protein